MTMFYLVTASQGDRLMSSALLTSKRQAFALAKTHHGIVHAAPRATFDGGRSFGIDGPTFRLQANVIADYRVDGGR